MVESPRLVVEKLTKEYRSGRETVTAVRDLSFVVQAGECFGLLGPNGAGKSTTINCLTGFYPLTSGSVSIDGFDVHRQPKSARQWLGVCPQEDTLDTDFSVLDQMVRHASFYRVPTRVARERATALLERFQLGDRLHAPVDELSGGMRRKLQVARALVTDPKVIVLDEPSTGLDPDARRILWDVLLDIRKRGAAILLSTHYMDEAERLCDRVAILHKGSLLDIETPQELVMKHVGAETITEEIRPGVQWKRAPNLEDVFLKLAGTKLVLGERL